MVYLTGDTHADFTRFNTKSFPDKKVMTKDDIVIILGDFGGVWYDDPRERYWLDWLNNKPFTTVYVCGNHENFDRLYSDEFELVDFYGGKAHKIRDSIFHLVRGHIFNLEGKKFFAFGGASSHDIEDGVLDLSDYKTKRDLIKDYNLRTKRGQMLRINHLSWWEQELPSKEEMGFGKQTLSKHNNKVDYVISHCLPQQINSFLGYFTPDILTKYFDELEKEGFAFKEWWSGHLHRNQYSILGKYNILYRDIIRLL